MSAISYSVIGLTEKAKKQLRKLLDSLKVNDLKKLARIMKNELSFPYSKMKREDLKDNLYDHLVFNPTRIKQLIEALAQDALDEYD